MKIVYLDSSVALHTILDGPHRERLRDWLQTPETLFVSSRLLQTEVIRVLRRDMLPLAEAEPLLDRVGLLDITRNTHTVAESIQRHIKTLDAMHLATALLVGEPVTIASHDAAMKSVATQLGLQVIDPIASET